VDRAALELVADVVRDSDVFCMVVLPRRGTRRACSACCTTAPPTPSPERDARAAYRGDDHPYRSSRTRLAEGDVSEQPVSDEVERGGSARSRTSRPT